MSAKKYLGMKPGDLDGKPYAKYWNPEMPPLSPQSQRALENGMRPSELGFLIEQADQLLDPGYLPLECGYTRLPNGQLFIATHTPMPGVTGEMIDWWFGWHYMENQRYKLWHPESHVANGALKMIGDDPAYTDREKYVGNTHYACEYFGSSLQRIEISFVEPSELLDTDRFEEAGVATAPTAVVTLQRLPLRVSTIIHLVRRTDEGCEMRVRLWMGPLELSLLSSENPINRWLGGARATRRLFDERQARAAFLSSAREMSHLPTFLPQLHADYHA